MYFCTEDITQWQLLEKNLAYVCSVETVENIPKTAIRGLETSDE